MPAIRQDHELWRGDAPTLQFTVVDDDGAPIDVTGWTAVYTLRRHGADPDPVSLSSAAVIFGPGTDGVFRVSITKAQTLALAVGPYQFSFKRTNAGNEEVLAFGVSTVRYDVLNQA